MVTTLSASSKLATNLPLSPMIPASPGPAPEAGVVQINLGAVTGQVVTGGEFGLATTMGDANHDYLPYADPTFQALANQYPTDLLRHNWELNTFMDILFPSRASASTPDFSNLDTYLNQQGNLKNFFNNQTATQIVTLGFPSWLNIADPADQALFAKMVTAIAQHFIAKGEPINNYELVNEPDGHYSVTDMANTFNVVAQALKSVDPSYKLGGLTESYARPGDLQAFFNITAPNVGFVSWHQYVTNGSDGKNAQQIVTDSMGVQNDAQTIRGMMRAAGIDDSVPMFLGEYNVNGAVYTDPNNENMVGAIAAAATTYGMIHSNTNMTMGALWDVMNDSAYSVFGASGNFRVDSVGITLGDLTSYMPGNLVQTTMPSDTPGLVGYTTTDNQQFSTALINTSLQQGYTVDLSKNGLPTTGLYRIEVSPANPQGTKTAITDLSHVSVAAGSLVIISDEDPHSGTELNGTTSTAPAATPVPMPTPTPDPTQAVPPATGTTPGSTSTGSATPGGSTTLPASGTTPGTNAGTGSVASPSATLPTNGTTSGDNAGGSGSGLTTTPPASSPASGTTPGDTNPAPGGVVTPPTVGAGSDSVVLKLSEDAYQGDAQFVFTVDGTPVGPVQSVTALHSEGQSETFTFKGDWTAGSHQFGVSFVNDRWDGTPATDRNLYIDGATFDGGQVATATALWSNNTVPFGTAPIMEPPSQPGGTGQAGTTVSTPAPVGTGPDTLVLDLSAAAGQGDAQVTVTVDGQAVGPAQSVTAVHGQGEPDAFTYKGDWGSGAHTVGVSFSNPGAGGSANSTGAIYLDGATLDGQQVQGATPITVNTPVSFALAGPLASPAPSHAIALLPGAVTVTDNNGSSAAVSLIASGTHTDHPNPTSTITQVVSNGTDTITSSGSLKGEAIALGAGTQKLILVNPRSMVITGGSGTGTVSIDHGSNQIVAGTGSLTVTGGSDASNYVLHAGAGMLTVEDFDFGKGDTLSVDSSLSGALQQASDGHGGTLLTFGAHGGSVDLISHATLNPSSISFI